MTIGAVTKRKFERVIVDSTVQKAVAFPADSRLLEGAHEKIARPARRAGIRLKLTHEREGKSLRRRAGDYAHAKQFKRPKKVRRKMGGVATSARDALEQWLQRAERLHAQRVHDKNKLYALHALEGECIGKARCPYEFEACSAFTRLTARTLAPPPNSGTLSEGFSQPAAICCQCDRLPSAHTAVTADSSAQPNEGHPKRDFPLQSGDVLREGVNNHPECTAVHTN